MSSFSPWHAFEKNVHKIQYRFGYRYNKQPLDWHEQSGQIQLYSFIVIDKALRFLD